MTIEQQKEKAREFMRALDCGNQSALDRLTAPNFVIELVASAPGFPQKLNRPEFLEGLPTMLRKLMPTGFNYSFGHAIAEGSHVSMQGTCDGVTGAGRRYANRYHWYFRFDNDKIDHFIEYMDSYVVVQAFAP
jgi:ketosteroid isomerase-like protein